MELQDEEFSSDTSDEIILEPAIKRFRSIAITSSEEEQNSSDSSNIIDLRLSLGRNILSASESEDDENSNNDINENEWLDPIGSQPRLKSFSGKPGLKMLDEGCTEIQDFYQLLVTEEMFQKIAEQTNLYAAQMVRHKQSRHLNKWISTNKNEIKRFFGLIMWMGLVKLPKLNLYWSKDPAFAQTFPRDIMPRNRFELILRLLHFANNEEQDSIDCLYKIKPIIDDLNKNFQKYYAPGEILCVDESMVPFRDRIFFRQYMKQKRHKYGIKIFKLCSTPGYTNTFQIYCGKRSDAQKTTPTNVVMSLCKNIFGKGHTLCTDNWYTSIDLAKQLIAVNTHLVGIVRSNRRGISKEVVKKKLKYGELFAKEHKNGMTLLKWKDKRDVLLLSTKHSTETVTITKRGQEYTRPKVLVDYNQGKSFVNISDQMTEYSSPLRKSIKWYKKLAFELLLNTSVVNAWIMYKERHNISIIEFKKQLSMYLTHCQNEVIEDNDVSYINKVDQRKRHEIKKKEGKMSTVRRRCCLCYKKNVKKFGSQRARDCTVKVATFCDDCPDKPHFCLPCFNTKHRFMPL